MPQRLLNDSSSSSSNPMSEFHTALHTLVHCFGEDLEDKFKKTSAKLEDCVNAAATRLRVKISNYCDNGHIHNPTSNSEKDNKKGIVYDVNEDNFIDNNVSDQYQYNGVVVLPPASVLLLIRAVELALRTLKGMIRFDHTSKDSSALSQCLESVIEFLYLVFMHIEEDVVHACLRVIQEGCCCANELNLIDVLVILMKQQEAEQKDGYFEQEDESGCFSVMTQGSSSSSLDIISRLFCTTCSAILSGLYLSRRCIGFKYSPLNVFRQVDDDTTKSSILEFMSSDSITFICKHALRVVVRCRHDLEDNKVSFASLVLQFFMYTPFFRCILESKENDTFRTRCSDLSRQSTNTTFNSVSLFCLCILITSNSNHGEAANIFADGPYLQGILKYFFDDHVGCKSTGLIARLKPILLLSILSYGDIITKTNVTEIIESYIKSAWDHLLKNKYLLGIECELTLEHILHNTLILHHHVRSSCRKILSNSMSEKTISDVNEIKSDIIENIIFLSSNVSFAISSSSLALLRCLISSKLAMDQTNNLFSERLSTFDRETLSILPLNIFRYYKSYSVSSPSMYLDFSASSGTSKASEEIISADQQLRKVLTIRCEIHLCLMLDTLGSLCRNEKFATSLIEDMTDDLIDLIESKVIEQYKQNSTNITFDQIMACYNPNLSDLSFYIVLALMKILVILASSSVNKFHLKRNQMVIENKYKDMMRTTYIDNQQECHNVFLLSFAQKQGSDMDLLRRAFEINSISFSFEQELEIVEAMHTDNLIRSRFITLQSRENEEYRSHIQDLTKNLQRIKQEYDHLRASTERERMSSIILARREALDIAQNHHEAKLKAEEEIANLKVRINDVENNLEIELSKRIDCESKLEDVQKRLHCEHEANNLLRETCTNYSTDLKEKELKLLEQKRDLEKAAENETILRIKIDKTYEKMYVLAEAYEKAVSEIRCIEDETEEIHNKYSKEIDSMSSKNTELEAKLQSVRNLISEYSKQHESLAIENAKLNAQIRSLSKSSKNSKHVSSSNHSRVHLQDSMRSNIQNRSNASTLGSSGAASISRSRVSTFKGISYLNSLGGIPFDGKENDYQSSLSRTKHDQKKKLLDEPSRRSTENEGNHAYDDRIVANDTVGNELNESSILM